VRRAARWREQPATDAQKALIRARWKVPAVQGWGDGMGDQRAKIDGMKKGEAANILTRLRHGAQVRRRSDRCLPSAEGSSMTGEI
jgi:ATP-dependent helicase IRC3